MTDSKADLMGQQKDVDHKAATVLGDEFNHSHRCPLNPSESHCPFTSSDSSLAERASG